MEETQSLLEQLGKSNYDRIPEDIVKRLDKIFDESNLKVADLKRRLNASQETIERLGKNSPTPFMFITENEKLRLANEQLKDDLNNSRQINEALAAESMETKANHTKKEKEFQATLKDSHGKEDNLRMVAQKYIARYTELKTELDEAASEPLAGPSAAHSGPESIHELSNRVTLLQEDINEMKKESERLRILAECEFITDAKNQFDAVYEANRQIDRDYQICVNQLQEKQYEFDSIIAALEDRLAAKHKELLDHDAWKQETIDRLTLENETLNTQVNQLHHQLQQHDAKPSTSAGHKRPWYADGDSFTCVEEYSASGEISPQKKHAK